MYFVTCLHCVHVCEWMMMMMMMMMMMCSCFLPVLFLCESHWQGAGLPAWTDLLWTNEVLLWAVPANRRVAGPAILFVYCRICYGKWACVRGRGRAGDSQMTSSQRDRRAHRQTHTHTHTHTHTRVIIFFKPYLQTNLTSRIMTSTNSLFVNLFSTI